MKKSLLIVIAGLLTCISALAQEKDCCTQPRIQIKGYGQILAEYTHDTDATTAATLGINKMEVLAVGQINDRWKWGVTVQFNSPVMLKDLYMQYTFAPQFRVRAGQFKTPFSYENQIAPFINPLITGGTMPTVYFSGVGMDPLYFGTSGRDMGVELSGDLLQNKLTYKLVAMNGQGMNAKDFNLGKLFGGALYVRPYTGLTLHTSYLGGKQIAMGSGKGVTKGESYTRHRASAGIIADYQPVTVSAEYMYGKDNGITAMGAYLTAVVHLPKRYDIVLSGDYLTTDRSAKEALYTGTIGVDKWFYGQCRMQLQYNYSHPTNNIPVGTKGHALRAQLQFMF